MIIVAGFLRMDPDQRASYLEKCEGVVRAGRAAPGCIDFHLSADPLEADRINIFEQWDSAKSVEAFRGTGLSDDQQASITEAKVLQHEIARSTALT